MRTSVVAMTDLISPVATPMLAAAVTAAWAVSVRDAAAELIVCAFALVGIGCAIVAMVFFPVRPSAVGTLTVALVLASYQLLLFVAFTYGNAARAQAIVNTNFVVILLYDVWSGTEKLGPTAACASAGIVVCTVVLVYSRA